MAILFQTDIVLVYGIGQKVFERVSRKRKVFEQFMIQSLPKTNDNFRYETQ